MIGRFFRSNDCTLPHILPQGRFMDGYPVIVLPQSPAKIIEGDTYEFSMSVTRDATYVIDGVKHRVCHATGLVNHSRPESDGLGLFTHHSEVESASVGQRSLAARLNPEAMSDLLALRANLRAARA